MGADPIATLTPWAAAGGAVAGVVAAGATMYLGLQTRRLGDLTRATTVHEQEQLELLRRDRDMRLRPVVEFHGYTVVAGSGPQRKAAILTVSNHGHGLAVNAFCVGRLMDERDGERLAVDPYMSVRPVHIPPRAERREIELAPPPGDIGLHAALLELTPGVSGVSQGGQEYALFCLDETGRTLHRFLFGSAGVDRWQAGEPPPRWVTPLLRQVSALKPEGVDLNALLNSPGFPSTSPAAK